MPPDGNDMVIKIRAQDLTGSAFQDVKRDVEALNRELEKQNRLVGGPSANQASRERQSQLRKEQEEIKQTGQVEKGSDRI